MKLLRVSIVLVLAAICLWCSLYWLEHRDGRVPEMVPDAADSVTVEPKIHESSLPGDAMLSTYAAETSTVQQDLTWISRVLDNFAVLVKGDTPIPLGANEEVAQALLGKNRAKLAFISSTSPALNRAGQLIDRWGTPLFFHAESAQKIDLRSAGPDRQMWTKDDVHRCHNGSFLVGEKLNPSSLFITPTR